MELNKAQVDAINHSNGPMLVLAGPGSGKTTVIAHRIKKLIEEVGVESKKILVISFTKASAIDMEHRFQSLANKDYKVTFGTFHSVFFRILRSKLGYQLSNIINEFEKNNILKGIASQLGVEITDEDEFIKNINSELTLIKNNLIDIEYYNSMNFSNDDFKSMYNIYNDYKEEQNKIDFDDMLYKCYKLLKEDEQLRKHWEETYDYILIDEFQDINLVQYRAIQMLRQNNKNIFVVGDDDQSIYKFRGANSEIILNFQKDFENCEKVILNTNYRSSNEIIKLSNKIIKENKKRFEKDIQGTDINSKYPTMLNYEDIHEESVEISKRINVLINEKGIEPKEIAVIYRTNMQGVSMVENLQNHNIPVILKDSLPSIYNHFIVDDILAYLKLALNNDDKESFRRIINKPKRYISKVLQDKILAVAGSPLNSIYKVREIRKWEVENIEGLHFYLRGIKKRNPYDAIKYIRVGANYDEYIEDYCKYKKLKPRNFFDILNELMESAKNFKDLQEFIDYCYKQRDNIKEKPKENIKEDINGVVLTTYHNAKGLEFEVVYLISLVDGVMPYELSKTESEIEEERRLFYVGITRAKKELYLSTIKSRYGKIVSKSIFLDNLIKRRK